MPTKKQLRSAKGLRNARKQKEKFPTIMKKVTEASDIIIEVLDARFPQDTRNIEIEELLKKKGKRIIYALNKADLIDKEQKTGLRPSVLVSCKNRTGIKQLRDKIKIEANNMGRTSRKMDRISVGVIGYPNTGKSSLINLLIGKSSAKTASEAGFTKGIQKLKLTSDIVLLDSPGVIPEKEYSSINTDAISKHAKVGARTYDKVRDPEMIVTNLMREYAGIIEEHYNIKANEDTEILLEELGRRINFLKKGGVVDTDRTARLILKDWQEGKIKIN